MPATIVLSEDVDDAVEEVIRNVEDVTDIRLNRKTLVPLIFSDPKEITEIVLKRIDEKLKNRIRI